ncbi:MAG: GNAT family N-acetyltransferase [Frankiales bacterium]|nr:GNAT family N-acetyltransferase [Frankiales bacterium]
MSQGPADLVGPGVTLVPVRRDEVDDVLAGRLGERAAGRGWPHDDTSQALAFTRTGGRTWLVVDAGGAVVGECGTKAPPDAAGTVEIGYGLAPASRGQGLGTRAVALLLQALGADPDVRLVIAHVDVGNTASRRLLERLGFSEVGTDGEGEVRYERPNDPGKVHLSN